MKNQIATVLSLLFGALAVFSLRIVLLVDKSDSL